MSSNKKSKTPELDIMHDVMRLMFWGEPPKEKKKDG